MLFLALSLQCQESGLSGKVTDSDGNALAGVTVLGGYSCCPGKWDKSSTDVVGDFRLANPGSAIHLHKEGFAPKAVVVKTGGPPIQIILSKENGVLTIPTCKPSPRGYKRVGFSHIRFDLPKHKVQIRGGKWDVDYVRYVVKLTNKGSALELWFGPYATSTEPDDKDFINSTDFTQREAILAGEGGGGTDSVGRTANGNRWRKLAFVSAGGALYRDASPQDAEVYNRIMDSACFIPFDESHH